MRPMRHWHLAVTHMSRPQKRGIMIAADALALPLALWSAYALRFAELWPAQHIEPFLILFPLLSPVGILIFTRLGLYRAVVRFMDHQVLWAVVKGVVLLAILMWATAYFAQWRGFPRSIPINFALVAFIYVAGSRFLVRSYYQWLIKHYTDKEAVAIYGAGGAGAQLAMALANSREYFVAAFLDDVPSLWGSTVQGVKVHDPDSFPTLIERFRVNRVLLALPSATKQQRKQALDRLAHAPLHVLTVPSMPEIVSGAASVDQLREVELEDLLGRDPIPPDQTLVDTSLRNKVVLVTGAGGSIGSELCRQIILAAPRALILYESSEYALYCIDQELRSGGAEVPPTYPLLGNVCDRQRIASVIQHYGVDTLYHAAAYKHVPLVEQNVLEGVRNNVFGTRIVAETAAAHRVARFILVSTDKAVRPTNVMGASKRLAELICQELSQRRTETRFAMVRFGNVLGSSGSVIPHFRQQIESGGPVTVTHAEITRYFMTIPEAAQLVIQAGSLANGGDVFVLDMGEPVKILDLARRMIQLSGLEVRDEANPEGDIEIQFSGLRPGEKLYEEWLIGDKVMGTAHPKILCAEEQSLPAEELHHWLDALESALQALDSNAVRQLLSSAVQGFVPTVPNVDLLLQPKGEVTPLTISRR